MSETPNVRPIEQEPRGPHREGSPIPESETRPFFTKTRLLIFVVLALSVLSVAIAFAIRNTYFTGYPAEPLEFAEIQRNPKLAAELSARYRSSVDAKAARFTAAELTLLMQSELDRWQAEGDAGPRSRVELTRPSDSGSREIRIRFSYEMTEKFGGWLAGRFLNLDVHARVVIRDGELRVLEIPSYQFGGYDPSEVSPSEAEALVKRLRKSEQVYPRIWEVLDALREFHVEEDGIFVAPARVN